MIFPNKEIVEQVRRQYPIGTRVELVEMDDFQAPPIGTKGTVEGVDDTASLLVAWDNGSCLNVVYGEDFVKKINTVKTICYGETDTWDSADAAMDFFMKAISASEGAERERYIKIYTKLKQGFSICSDEE